MLIIKTELFEKFMSRFAGVDMTDKNYEAVQLSVFDLEHLESSLRDFSGEYSEQEIFEEEIKTFDFVKSPEGVWSLDHSDFPDDSFDSTVLRKIGYYELDTFKITNFRGNYLSTIHA